VPRIHTIPVVHQNLDIGMKTTVLLDAAVIADPDENPSVK
jgi:hypothetical protein